MENSFAKGGTVHSAKEMLILRILNEKTLNREILLPK